MKRILILLFSSVLLLSSCNTLTKTSRTAETSAMLQSATVVDLEPATEHRITYTMEPTEEILRGGPDNVKQAAESEALAMYGNADVLLEPQYVISKRRSLFGSKITSITVSGRPAYYTNFRALDDSVWCNPVFRGVNQHQRALPFANKIPLTKKVSQSNESAFRSKGLAMYLTPFIGGGDFECEHAYGDNGTAAAVLFSLGYQLNPYLYLGAGIGVNGMGGGFVYDELDDGHPKLDGAYMPLFADLRLNFSSKKNTAFVDYKVGAGILGDAEISGPSAFMGIAVGYSMGNLDVAFQMLMHGCEFDYEKYNDRWGGYVMQYDEFYFVQYGISLGFRF